LALTDLLISSPAAYPTANTGIDDSIPKLPNIALNIIHKIPPPIATPTPTPTALA
tara:strand:- start:3453 stop:3617 length:165 start_codon:yes stop_codon:yes gene_type:complete